MTAWDIITPQVEPSPLLISLTYAHKANGTLRVCLDPGDLNKAIIYKHHKAPILEEITSYIRGSTTCSKLESKIGFLGIHLTHKSHLLTFNTHVGRYHFRYMPFGLQMSIFQMKMNQVVERCPRILCIPNDLYIYDHSEKEHDASNSGLVLNGRKYRIKHPKITFCHDIQQGRHEA